MTGRLLRETGDLADVAETAAQQLGDVDAEMLVKDYWVTQALRVIQKRHPGEYVFKGGTSLTKALRCVDRFSEGRRPTHHRWGDPWAAREAPEGHP